MISEPADHGQNYKLKFSRTILVCSLLVVLCAVAVI